MELGGRGNAAQCSTVLGSSLEWGWKDRAHVEEVQPKTNGGIV